MLQNSSALFKFHEINKSLIAFLAELPKKFRFSTRFRKVCKKVNLITKKAPTPGDKSVFIRYNI